ncbi:hypothetical protein GCM10023219_22150 [Stakelama sediminis]|nr:hypothetical protein [Stakelama sediminis]
MPQPADSAFRHAVLAAHERREAVARQWYGSRAFKEMCARLEQLGEDDAGLNAARAMLTDRAWPPDLLSPLVSALQVDAFADLPVQMRRDATGTTLALWDSGRARLSVALWSASELNLRAATDAVVLPGERVLTAYHRAGTARLQRWELTSDTSRLRRLADITISDGDVVLCDGRYQVHRLVDARCDIVAVQIRFRGEGDGIRRQYRCSDGQMLSAEIADPDAARRSMLLTLLRVSGRSDAAAQFEAATRHRHHFLRWEAMREWLALDALSAQSRLREMAAADAHAEVRKAAAHMLAVVERRRMEEAQTCPA